MNQAEKIVIKVEGMDCASCARVVESAVRSVEGVRDCNVNFSTSSVQVTLQDESHKEDTAGKLIKAIRSAGYGAEPVGQNNVDTESTPVRNNDWISQVLHIQQLRAAITAGFFYLLGVIFGFLNSKGIIPQFPEIPSILAVFGLSLEKVNLIQLIFYGLAIVFGGYNIARSGVIALLRTRTASIDLLMTIAVLGAVIINQWAEAATVVMLFSLGEGMESLTINRARNAIQELLQIAPQVARIRRGSETIQLPVEEVELQDVMLVRPGERIAMDGRVISGYSTVNQAPITGESLPVEKSPGDEVYAGTLNQRGYLEVEVTKLAEDSTLARITRLIETAGANRAKTERFMERFAKYYTPAVIALAILLAVIPPLMGEPFIPWFYRALTLLVISCPCALVISTPVAIVAALANASRHGMLIKGGGYIELAGQIGAIAFDKTGTLTHGRPEVVEVYATDNYEPEEVISLAATIEERSEHPLAAAILRRRELEVAASPQHVHGDQHQHLYPHDESEFELIAKEISDFEAITGRGARATIDGTTYYIGTPRLFEELGVDISRLSHVIKMWQEDGRTVLVVGSDREVFGAIAVEDEPRPESREVIQKLKENGIQHIVMLTGDNSTTARSLAQRLGIDEYRAELLPEDKVQAIRELKDEYGKVAMVGDGINDAPAMAAADLGIAMGAAGSDTAIETSDIALMSSDLTKLPFAIKLSRSTLTTIKSNIAFSLFIKAAIILLSAIGITSLWLAILADTGASIIVTANAMRILRHKPAE